MGNSKSKKVTKEPDKFFEREKFKEQKREEKRKKNANPKNKRMAVTEAPVPAAVMAAPGPASPPPPPAQVRSFNDEALDLMRYQMRNDADAFLLNNILLSVQFFENYEREMQHIKNNPISEREHLINEAMVRHNKHVFFADRLQENVNENIAFQKARQLEPLSSPRLFVIYDNVEASEPGDTSDYSAVLDAPFYKLRIEDCKEPGFVKLKKLEVLESTLAKDSEPVLSNKIDSGDSVYTDSEKESNDSDDSPYSTKGEALLQKIKNKINVTTQETFEINSFKLNPNPEENMGRRRSGPIKQVSLQVEKNSITNMNKLKKADDYFNEEDEEKISNHSKVDGKGKEDGELKPRKSILKSARRLSGPVPDGKYKQNLEIRNFSSESVIYEDTETSGYRSNSSSRQYELSESESDYGYSTIKEATTPKRVQLSMQSNDSHCSGVLPDETWITIETRAVGWSDDEDDDDDITSNSGLSKTLYESHQFLSSTEFMGNFVDNFIINLGNVLGLSHDAVKNSLTQGASVYCDTVKNGSKLGNEIFPALIASWPNTANQWIIRERKIIQNPRTNFSYQWPTKYMVSKAIGFGCVLVPIGFRSKRGLNADQKLQWKIIFPAAERYLESCLAHAHMRCYLFALALQKSFLECEISKIGIDANHFKNHLFWRCEDNYARWPEHRLGETLRMFLRSFYGHLGQGRFPNYFIENCNDFKSIPKPILLKQQKKLADIMEAPVMHILSAIDKLKYTKKEFYPALNVHRLYDILTSKNPLRILNPNLPAPGPTYADSSESDDEETDINFWDKAKKQDKHYQWKKEMQRQMQSRERRKAQFHTRRQRSSMKQEREIKTNIILPKKMEVERRKLVLEFFIPHFIAMARSSEKFEAIKQAVIYLEQAQRLSILLKEEPASEYTANEYLDVIRDKLVDCQRKLVMQGGYKLPPRRDSFAERPVRPFRKSRPRYENISNQDSPSDSPSFSAFTFVEVHAECSSAQDPIKLNEIDEEESKL